LINLDEIGGYSAISKLKGYEGKNPYIKKMKKKLLADGKIILTPTQSKYVMDNFDKEPMLINKIVNITEFLGESLQQNEKLTFKPERILIEFMLADSEKTYHVYGKLTKKQAKSGMYFLPKTQVVDDPYFQECDIDVDFEKYEKLDSFIDSEGKVGRKILDHQKSGIKFLLTRNGAILADDMGLGKSMQSIVAAIESGAKKILIVCPSSAKINWQREINYLQEEDITIISGSRWSHAKFTIINFDILKNFHTLKDDKNDGMPPIRDLVNSNFDLCIIDEAHNLRNHKSIRGAIMTELCVDYGIERVWLLSGTPVANRPMDFYNLLRLIKSPLVDNWKFYAQRYCEGKQITTTLKNRTKRKIWITNGASNLDELSIKTRNLLLRRMKDEVLDMPDKIRVPNYFKMSNKQQLEYDSLWEDYLLERKKQKKKGTIQRDLVELGLLRKYIAMETIPETMALVDEVIEQGHKVIIFTCFTDELNALAEHYGNNCVIHYGELNEKEKQKSVDKFQMEGGPMVFIGNIISAGIAITLTRATYVVFNSFDWVPGNSEQAEDRCIFGGQLVMTNYGYKKIEDIEIGDIVYTHLGNFKKVVEKHTHLERKKLRVDINAFGYNRELSVTDDHKLFIYDSELNIFEWVEAKNLNIKKHFLTLKSNKQPNLRKKYLDVTNYISDTFTNNFNVEQKNGRLVNMVDKVELTNELLYAFGFFIAEGWAIDNNKNKGASVNICQKIDNDKMYDAAKYIIDIFKNSFNIDNHGEYTDKHNVKTCSIYSKNLAINFNKWFGKGVKNKKMPEWVDELNDEQLQSLLNGFNHGDGYERKNIQQNVTASTRLGSELVRYNANLNHNVRFSIKTLNGLEYYQSECSTNMDNKLNKIVKKGEYIIYPIKSLHISKPKRGHERVYDLSVEDDHSFVVGNYNVHNCYRLGQKNNVTVYYNLFENTIVSTMWHTLNRKKSIINQIMSRNDNNTTAVDEIVDYIIEDKIE
jgi:hypothetical protein